MINRIEQLLAEIEAFAPQTAADVEAFRIKILGKKGELGMLMEEFKSVPSEQKRELGQKLNNLKNVATERINTLKEALAQLSRWAHATLSQSLRMRLLASLHALATP